LQSPWGPSQSPGKVRERKTCGKPGVSACGNINRAALPTWCYSHSPPGGTSKRGSHGAGTTICSSASRIMRWVWRWFRARTGKHSPKASRTREQYSERGASQCTRQPARYCRSPECSSRQSSTPQERGCFRSRTTSKDSSPQPTLLTDNGYRVISVLAMKLQWLSSTAAATLRSVSSSAMRRPEQTREKKWLTGSK